MIPQSPGHSDIYSSLLLTKKLINADIKYLFVSNSDNLGATIDKNSNGILIVFITIDY